MAHLIGCAAASEVRGDKNGDAPTSCVKALKMCKCDDGSVSVTSMFHNYTDCAVCPAGKVRGKDGKASAGCTAATGICVPYCQAGFAANLASTACKVCATGGLVRGNAAGTTPGGCVTAKGICSTTQKATGGKCVTCPSGLLATPDFKDCCKRTKISGKYVCVVPPTCSAGFVAYNGKCVPITTGKGARVRRIG